MRIAALVVFCTFLLWRPSVAQQQQSKTHAGKDKANREKQVVPPAHVVIDPPFPAVAYPQTQSSNAQTQPPETPLPRFFRSEWVIVYITAVYVFFTGWILWTIRRQADNMDRQTESMQGQLQEMRDAGKLSNRQAAVLEGQLDEMKKTGTLMQAQLEEMRKTGGLIEGQLTAMQGQLKTMQDQVDFFISKERARLRVDMKPLSLPATPDPGYAVDFAVTVHGPTDAFITENLCVAYIYPWEVIDKPELADMVMFPIHPLPKVVSGNNAPLDCYAFLNLHPASEQQLVQEVKAKRLFVGIRGFIRYKDVFDRERETTFRYVWKYSDLQGLDDYGQWMKCGSPEENRET